MITYYIEISIVKDTNIRYHLYNYYYFVEIFSTVLIFDYSYIYDYFINLLLYLNLKYSNILILYIMIIVLEKWINIDIILFCLCKSFTNCLMTNLRKK